MTFSSANLDIKNLDGANLTESLREIGNTFGTELGYDFPYLNLSPNYNAQYVSEKNTVDNQVTKGYSTHNISARWNDAAGIEGLSFIFCVDNLPDKTYTSHAPATPSTLFLDRCTLMMLSRAGM